MRYVKAVIEMLWNAVVRGIIGCAVIYMLEYLLMLEWKRRLNNRVLIPE